jgi:hypothetical protein
LFQRLHLTRPLDGTFRDANTRVLEVTSNGAVLDAASPLQPGTRGTLRFTWREHLVAVEAQVAAVTDTEAKVEFTGDTALLSDLIAISAAEVLRAQQANMDGDRAANVIGDETLTSASVLHGLGYVTWTFEDGEWRKRKSLLPDQPENGFTVASAEPAEQVEVLRQTWEKGDEEARRMTRMLAELSAASVRQK